MPKRYTDAQRELVKEIRRLNTNINRRLSRIYYKYGEEEISLKVYRRYKQQLKNAFYKLDEKSVLHEIKISPDTSITDLRQVRRNLYRLDLKKSTTVKDFNTYTETIYQAVSYGVDIDEAFDLYDRLVNENGLLANYKYELVQKIVEYKYNNLSEEEIADNIRKIYDKIVGGAKNVKEAHEEIVSENYEKFYDYKSFYR